MAPAPQYGTMIFRGTSGATYVKDVYISDVNGAPIRFDSGAGASATSQDFTKFPEDVYLVDFSVVTGLTDTTKIRLTGNGSPSGYLLRYSIHVTTIATRPALAIGVNSGSNYSAIQLT